MKFKTDMNSNGMGLGLTICKKITDAMGGRIFCKSQIDVGTIMTIEIPLNQLDISGINDPLTVSNDVDNTLSDRIHTLE